MGQSKTSNLILWILGILVSLTIYSCKTSSKSPSNSGVGNDKRCSDSMGRWTNNSCDCTYNRGYRRSIADPNICERDPYYDEDERLRCQARGVQYDWIDGSCRLRDPNATGDLSRLTAMECENRLLYWNNNISGAYRCQQTPPTNQLECLRAMHHWDGQACRIRAASEKAQYCQAASAQGQVQWIAESVECRCTSNTTFIFNGQQCVPPNQMQQGFGGQQQYYDPASGCGLSGGQWMQNNMCQCPMGPNGVAIQWDQMTNSCRSSSFQGGCPYWNGQQCLAAPGGAVLIYNMIFGWVTKSLLDSLF